MYDLQLANSSFSSGNRLGYASRGHSNRLSVPSSDRVMTHRGSQMSLVNRNGHRHTSSYSQLPVLSLRGTGREYFYGLHGLHSSGSSRGPYNNEHHGMSSISSADAFDSSSVASNGNDISIGGGHHLALMEAGKPVLGIPGATSLSNGTLVIPGVTEQAQGEYACEANNGVGSGISEVVMLTIHGESGTLWEENCSIYLPCKIL